LEIAHFRGGSTRAARGGAAMTKYFFLETN
jgi:hypothetical protein